MRDPEACVSGEQGLCKMRWRGGIMGSQSLLSVVFIPREWGAIERLGRRVKSVIEIFQASL